MEALCDIWWSAFMLSISWCCVMGRCLSFGRPWHDLLWILLHSDRQVFVDQTSCHTSSDAESCITLQGWSATFSYIFKLPSVVFITFAQYIITIVFVHQVYYYTFTFFTRRLDRCLNGHMTTGIMNFYYSCLSHQATLSAAVLCVFSYQDLYPFIHILGTAHTSDVVNAISASFLTSLSENTSCCTHFCLAVPSLSFISVKLALPLDWALPSLALALSAPTPQHYNCHAPFTYVDLPTQEGVPLWVSLG